MPGRIYKPTTSGHQMAQSVKELVASKGTIDQEVFLADLMEVFGGSRKLAVAMYDEFQSAPRGGLARQKLLHTIQHLIISTTSMNLTKVVNPSDLTDQDLKDLLGDYFEKVETGRLVAPPDSHGKPEVSGREALVGDSGEALDMGEAGGGSDPAGVGETGAGS